MAATKGNDDSNAIVLSDDNLMNTPATQALLQGADSEVSGEKAPNAGVGDRRDAPCEWAVSITVLPLGPRIIVEKIKETGVSEGGIYMPEHHQRDPRKREITLSRGRVLSIGELKEVKMKTGDIVVYADQTAIPLKIGGITYGDVLYEEDVIAIIGG